jgi:TfoX/Sxy family transcriptional regulator of competence genes
MAYDEALADRIRRVVGPRPDVIEKKMFGGIAFLLDGKMFVGIVKDDLMVRVGPDRYDAAIAEAHVRPMDFTGRPMNGYVYVGPGGSRTEKAIKKWVDQGAAFVATIDGSPKKKRSKPRTRAG